MAKSSTRDTVTTHFNKMMNTDVFVMVDNVKTKIVSVGSTSFNADVTVTYRPMSKE